MKRDKQNTMDSKTGKVFSESIDNDTYQEIEDLKKDETACNGDQGIPLAVSLDGNEDVVDKDEAEPKAGKGLSVSLKADNVYEDVLYPKSKKAKSATKGAELNLTGGDGYEKPQGKKQDWHKTRYEENPVAMFPKKKENRKQEAISNPIYGMNTTQDTNSEKDRKHIYENVIKIKNNTDREFKISEPAENYDDVGDNSIINPLYDMAEPSCQDDDQEPLYEDIPAVKLPEKTKKRSYRKSLSLERNTAYEELDDDKEDCNDDVFTDSKA